MTETRIRDLRELGGDTAERPSLIFPDGVEYSIRLPSDISLVDNAKIQQALQVFNDPGTGDVVKAATLQEDALTTIVKMAFPAVSDEVVEQCSTQQKMYVMSDFLDVMQAAGTLDPRLQERLDALNTSG